MQRGALLLFVSFFLFLFFYLCFIYVYTSGLINATIFFYMFIYKMIKIKSHQILITLVTLHKRLQKHLKTIIGSEN